MVNCETRPTAKSIGVANLIWPITMVPIQLKIFTPVGTAMIIVVAANTEFAVGPSPVVNMWCAHTPKPRNPMAAVA